LDLDVMELADIIGSASDQDDMAQVMAASCTTTSVPTTIQPAQAKNRK
jgi:thiazolylpeptide-type bacteriocin precursor